MTQNRKKERKRVKRKTKKFLKKLWWTLWEDDSLKGWIFSVVFLFIFIKFIFFPFLALITGTALPLAIVESCSMIHEGNFFSDYNEWWEKHEQGYSQYGIEKQEFMDFSLRGGFNKGDILFIVRANPEKLKVGDVIIFSRGSGHPVIHRIVKIQEQENGKIFTTMGDNVGQVQFFEREITEDLLVGKAVFKLAPYAGWVKLIFYDWRNPPSEKGLC